MTMKHTYLLPYKFKRIGMWMFIPFCAMCLWCIISGELEFDYFHIPALAICVQDLFENPSILEVVKNDPINEIAMLGFLVSLCFIALSKERDEDEMTGQIRMSSLVWSLWITAVVLAFGILFFYQFSFLYFCFSAIYFVFLLYILKFNITMHKVRRVEK